MVTPLLNRRQLLAPAVGAALAAPALALAARPADLRSFGAKGDGRTDDAAAVLAALRSGRPVDGAGRTYAVFGSLRPGPAFRGLSNCVLRQLDPSGRNRTLFLEQSRSFQLSGLAVQRASRGDDDFTQRDMMENAGVWLQDCADFDLERVQVSGGGVGTGLVINQCRRFTASDLQVSAIRYRRRQRPDDDILQGMWINRCSDFDMVRPRVTDLGGQDALGFSRDNNRAIALGGSRRFRIQDLEVSDCGQGLDVTGSEGNREFVILRGRARSCWTWGFKFANSAQLGCVTDAAAQDCGLGGFVVSGRSELTDPHPQAIEIIDCRAVDCGRPELPNTTFGFGVLRARPDPDYPRRVRFVRCEAADLRARAGMKWGFFNEISAEGEDRNLAQDCTSFGASVAPFFGFGRRHS